MARMTQLLHPLALLQLLGPTPGTIGPPSGPPELAGLNEITGDTAAAGIAIEGGSGMIGISPDVLETVVYE